MEPRIIGAKLRRHIDELRGKFDRTPANAASASVRRNLCFTHPAPLPTRRRRDCASRATGAVRHIHRACFVIKQFNGIEAESVRACAQPAR
jgi:hypothetical protein